MVENLTSLEVARLLRTTPGTVALVDVREPSERATARIDPSIHIPMGEIPDRLPEIPKDRRLVIYCHHGSRSMMVAHFLESNGFPGVANLSEGIDGWSAQIDRSVPRY